MSERKEDNGVKLWKHYLYTSQMCHLCNRKEGLDAYVVHNYQEKKKWKKEKKSQH